MKKSQVGEPKGMKIKKDTENDKCQTQGTKNQLSQLEECKTIKIKEDTKNEKCKK
jgi:hypothetical protein